MSVDLPAWPEGVLAVICSRTGDPYNRPAPGSQRETCWACSHAVWLSHATREAVAGQDYRILCLECAVAYEAQRRKSWQVREQTEAQKAEQKRMVEAN